MKATFTVDQEEDGFECIADLAHATEYKIIILEMREMILKKMHHSENMSEETFCAIESLYNYMTDVINRRISPEL